MQKKKKKSKFNNKKKNPSPVYFSGTTRKVNRVYSGSRLILRPSLEEISSVVFV